MGEYATDGGGNGLAGRTTLPNYAWSFELIAPETGLLLSGDDVPIDLLFFAIHRLEFDSSVEDCTEERFLARNLVTGESCWVHVPGRAPFQLRLVESAVIPASIGRYRLTNDGGQTCKAVKAFVKA